MNGCDWNADTCSAAAEGGHLTVLQRGRVNGCDWNADTCMSRIIVAEWSLVAYHLASREYSELGCSIQVTWEKKLEFPRSTNPH
jgi:hypothetical protein